MGCEFYGIHPTLHFWRRARMPKWCGCIHHYHPSRTQDTIEGQAKLLGQDLYVCFEYVQVQRLSSNRVHIYTLLPAPLSRTFSRHLIIWSHSPFSLSQNSPIFC